MNLKIILSRLFMWLPAAMMIMSAGAKFAAVPQVVEGLTKVGFLPYFPLPLLATLEVVCVVAFVIPRTWRLGFFLMCGYLGGAGAIEIAGHHAPMALGLLTCVWVGAYLKDPSLFGIGGTQAPPRVA